MPNEAFGHSQSHSHPPAGEADVAYRGFATKAIRTGQSPCVATGATIVPVYQTATFTQEGVGVTKGFDYSRSGNPTRLALERQLAVLEGARFGSAFGSGMAAVAGVAALLSQGDHIVATRDLYGGTHRLFSDVLTRYGITTTFADLCDTAAARAAIRPNTKLIWIETPSNPLLRVTDIRAIAALKAPGRVVVHSTTKYLCGHSDVVGGIVITDDQALHEQIAFHQNAVGAVPGPWDAYLTLRGVKTLAVRMREHERNARAIAAWLETRGDVATVYYPGLASHPHHELAKRQMRGFGGIISLRVRGGGQRALEFARRLRIFNLATSLGGVESLVCSPTAMTHASVPAARKEELGITDDLLRLSVGIEDLDDLVADLSRALDATLFLAEREAAVA